MAIVVTDDIHFKTEYYQSWRGTLYMDKRLILLGRYSIMGCACTENQGFTVLETKMGTAKGIIRQLYSHKWIFKSHYL